ncbi:succinyl-diaminopimelate desuccinylase [Streptosporangium album]|uniref:Succinyl-diaminopimelate desuccinylase n=1 Tax=Streptosporangium album TaxID=47479 RepID=A0A7W7WF41_9ACTN|nr:M20 family metallopeptidase [Streptosporangium album]MBB4944024.1 succinyl-diaminopimelate desuccinylase [Streptosporangium album]
MTDVVELTRELIRIDSVGGGEAAVAEPLARRLEAAGFEVRAHAYAPGRTGVVARWGTGVPVTLTGHLDTVPLGGQDWTYGPHAAEVDGDRLYGRGSSDMKAGVAALVVAAERHARGPAHRTALEIVLTVGEETGCEGAIDMIAQGLVGRSRGLLVAEPTANRALLGHKGALWLKVIAQGRTAHGSMPHLGDNAVYKLARAVGAVEHFDFGLPAHPWLGAPSVNVGTVHGGINVNSVPDLAEATVDMRTVTGQDHAELRERLRKELGGETSLEVLTDLPAVWTDPDDPFVRALLAAGASPPGDHPAASYFTDASVLTTACGAPPIVICGPGEPEQAHVTDEYCEIPRIEKAVEIYAGALALLAP